MFILGKIQFIEVDAGRDTEGIKGWN
jgi:hypothetical protein